MTWITLLIALAHTLPVIAVTLITRERAAPRITAALVSLLRILSGPADLLLFDMVVLFMAYLICERWVSTRPSYRQSLR